MASVNVPEHTVPFPRSMLVDDCIHKKRCKALYHAHDRLLLYLFIFFVCNLHAHNIIS